MDIKKHQQHDYEFTKNVKTALKNLQVIKYNTNN